MITINDETAVELSPAYHFITKLVYIVKHFMLHGIACSLSIDEENCSSLAWMSISFKPICFADFLLLKFDLIDIRAAMSKLLRMLALVCKIVGSIPKWDTISDAIPCWWKFTAKFLHKIGAQQNGIKLQLLYLSN